MLGIVPVSFTVYVSATCATTGVRAGLGLLAIAAALLIHLLGQLRRPNVSCG